jgi:hypothetical protein
LVVGYSDLEIAFEKERCITNPNPSWFRNKQLKGCFASTMRAGKQSRSLTACTVHTPKWFWIPSTQMIVNSSCPAKTKSGADRSPVILPPRPLWKQYFPTTLKPFPYRVTLANPTTAAEVANAFIPENSVDKVVVEIFPGILKRIRLRRHRFIVY